MKIEEYENLAAGLTNENAPAVVKDMLAGIKQDLTERDALAGKVADLETKNRDLQDTNIKLFLQQTAPGKPAEVDDDDKTGLDALDAFADAMKEKHKEEK